MKNHKILIYIFSFSLLFFFAGTAFSSWKVDINPPTVTISATCNGTAIINNGTCANANVNISILYTDNGANDAGLKTITHTITGALDNGTYDMSGPSYTYTKQITNSVSPVTISAQAVDQAGNLGNATSSLTFNFTYTITGNVYLDENKNGIKDGSEVNYAGIPDIRLSGKTVVNNADGTYSITGLQSGNNYTVRLFTTPSTYYPTYPQGSYAVTLPCASSPPSWVPATSPYTDPPQNLASCSGGDISGLNFGITQLKPWFQCIGADCRSDDSTKGFVDKLPTNNPATQCVAGYSSAYASLPGVMSNSPGIIFSGDAGPDLGAGYSSSQRWQVGGSGSYAEVFQPTRPNVIRTSYEYVDRTLNQNGITATDLITPTNYCGGGLLSNCQLSNSIPNGVYKANGNLTLKSNTFAAGKNYVFLINGDLTITGNITVPIGSTATFIVANDIIVDPTVGTNSTGICDPTTPAHNNCNIEGFFSAGRNFTIQSSASCSGKADKRLNIDGAIVVNAGLTGGTLQNNRDLCDAALTCPALSITERPDFALNAPELLKHSNYVWQEVAP